jgi:hypothetical protein
MAMLSLPADPEVRFYQESRETSIFKRALTSDLDSNCRERLPSQFSAGVVFITPLAYTGFCQTTDALG